eukprot:9168709-Pyramimonas_sp.AAC.1
MAAALRMQPNAVLTSPKHAGIVWAQSSRHFQSGQGPHRNLLAAAMGTLARGFLGTSATPLTALIWQLRAARCAGVRVCRSGCTAV